MRDTDIPGCIVYMYKNERAGKPVNRPILCGQYKKGAW